MQTAFNIRAVALVILIAALLAAGCSGRKKADKEKENTKPTPLVELDSGYRLDPLWSVKVGTGLSKNHHGLTMVVSGDRIYAADAFGIVEARGLKTGRSIWQARIPDKFGSPKRIFKKRKRSSFVSGGLNFGEDLLFVGTIRGEAIALRPKNGLVRWRTQLSSEVLSSPYPSGNLVFVQTLDGKLSALQIQDGKKLWSYDNPVPRLTLRGSSSPVVFGGRVFAGFASGKLSVLNTTDGELIWEQRVALAEGRSELARIIDVDAPVFISNGLVYAISYQSNIRAFRLTDGAVIWEQAVNSSRGITGGFGQIYAVNEKGHVVALNDGTGDLVWTNEDLSFRSLSSPVAFSNYVAVGDKQGYVHILSQTTGELLAYLKVGKKGIRTAPVSNSNTLYVLTSEGQLSALRIRNPPSKS